jgi:hypothetical protein
MSDNDPWLMNMIAAIQTDTAWRDPGIRYLLNNGWTPAEVADVTGVDVDRVRFAEVTSPDALGLT